MKKGLKTEVGKPVFFTALVIVLGLVAWYGWNMLAIKAPDGRAIVDAAARYQAAHGIDIKTVPTWSDMWYKYHPEYKGPHPPVKMPDVNVAMPGAAPAPGVPGPTAALPGTPGIPASSGSR